MASFFGEKLFWFLTHVARSCVVYFEVWAPYINPGWSQTLFFCLSLPNARITGVCCHVLLEVHLGFQDIFPSCPGILELGKGVCWKEAGSFFLESHSTLLIVPWAGKSRSDRELLRYLLIGREILRELWELTLLIYL